MQNIRHFSVDPRRGKPGEENQDPKVVTPRYGGEEDSHGATAATAGLPFAIFHWSFAERKRGAGAHGGCYGVFTRSAERSRLTRSDGGHSGCDPVFTWHLCPALGTRHPALGT